MSNFTRQPEAVIAWHKDKRNEYAIVIAAIREGDGDRRILTQVFVMQNTPMATMCPQCDPYHLIRSTGVDPARHERLLQANIDEYLRHLRNQCRVLGVARTGFITNLTAASYRNALGNFRPDNDGAVSWLFNSQEYGEQALKTLCLARKMAVEQKLDAPTGDNIELPTGFFRVITADGTEGLGYNDGPGSPWGHALNVGSTVVVANRRVSVPRQEGESMQDAIAKLPVVRLSFIRRGSTQVGGSTFVEQFGEWDGQTSYNGDHKDNLGNNLDGGLW